MRHSNLRWRLVILLALGALMAPAVSADWLVTTDGARVETQGPWEVRGALVVFTTPLGALASLRLREVDLDASETATAEAEAAATAPAEEPAPDPREVFVLTDRDVAHVPPDMVPSAFQTDEVDASENAEPTSSAAGAKLSVASWQDRPGPTGLVFTGELRNDGDQVATHITLTLRLLDVDGEEIAAQTAHLDSPVLQPGDATRFRVGMPDVTGYVSAEFDTHHRDLAPTPRPGEVPADGAGQTAGGEES